jgi:diguanylate cyclase (GGDEF)-like protein
MFPTLFLDLAVEKQAIIIYLTLMMFATSFGALVLHSVRRYLGCIQTRKIKAAQRALALSLLGFTCFVGYQFGHGDLFEFIAIIGNLAFIACGFQVISTCMTVHPNRKLLLLYQAHPAILTALFMLFCFCTFVYPISYVRATVTIVLFTGCYLIGSAYRCWHWRQMNFGDKIVTLSFIYCVLTSLMPLSDRPGTTAHSLNAAIVLSQLPTMLGWFCGTLVSLISIQLHRLNELSEKDWLTGLYNERRFFDRAPDFVMLASRKKSTCCVAFLDLDHFKSLNSTYSPEVGDIALKSVAEIIQSSSRHTDISARMDGQEFVLFLPFETQESALAVVERIRSRVEKTVVMTQSEPITLTISAGLHQLGVDETVESGVERANEKMHQAKAKGRNQVVFSTAVLFDGKTVTA